MKTEIREIITDIKAAALIGLDDSLWLTLDSLLQLPQISGNPKMEEPFIHQAILPIGETIADSKLALLKIQPIGKTSYAALRGICAVALTSRFFSQDQGSLKEIDSYMNDPRQDVQLCLSVAVEKFGEYNPRKLVELMDHYFIPNSPRSLSLTIRLLPALLKIHPEKAFEFLKQIPYSNDNDLRLAFSNTLSNIANLGYEERILDYMEDLLRQKEDYLWPITKCLSGAWAEKYPNKTLAILEKLSLIHGPHKLISNSLKAMIRHGAEELVGLKLAEWKRSQQENLQLAAKQFNNKLDCV